MTIGIYAIVNTVNDKCYIGSSVFIERRIRQHKAELKKNKHHAPYLQKSWNKYSEANFEFRVLETIKEYELCDNLALNDLEQMYLSSVDCEYNVLPIAGSTRGIKLTDEQRLARSGKGNGFYGKNHLEETKRILSLKHTGKTLSKEHIEKIANSNKGKIRTEETRRKIGNANRGKKWTDEQKEKLKKPISTESKLKMSKAKEKFTYKVLTPTNEEYIITNLREFTRQHNLDFRAICRVINGKNTHHKQYKVEKLGLIEKEV